MNLYFDYAATTKVCDEAFLGMEKAAKSIYGNPSSLHSEGMKAEDMIVEAKKYFAKQLGSLEKEIFFTSGGTESNNLAIQGVAKAYSRSGLHIITTQIEHPSVGSTLAFLSDEGFEITWLPVNSNGLIDLDDLKDAIREDTILVSIMHVNNEIGAIQDLDAIGKLIKEVNPKTLFHVDGVQGFMKFKLNVKKSKVDLYSASSHKIYGPKGCGFLYIKNGTKLKPLLYGGSQQFAVRPGTENVPGIIGFYEAAKVLTNTEEKRYEQVCTLKNLFVQSLKEALPNWKLNSQTSIGVFDKEISSPYITSIRSESIKGEVILHALEDYQINVSTGSACSSKKLNISHVLKAIHLEDVESDRSIRISFSWHQDEEDIKALVKALVQINSTFGRFVKR